MSGQQPPPKKVLVNFASFFEKALDALKPPYMKLLTVFVVALLLALFLVEGSTDLGFVLFAVVLVIFSCLTAALVYAEIRSQYQYSQRTQEELKSALREIVLELQAVKRGHTPLNPVNLIQILDTRFDTEEVRSLCFELHTRHPDRMTHPSLDYDSLSGQGKAAKVRELVLYCQRRGMLVELYTIICEQRPDAQD
jgi:hypothetical protein